MLNKIFKPSNMKNMNLKKMPPSFYIKREAGIPTPEGGAPSPMVIAEEHSLIIAYYPEQEHADFDGMNPIPVSVHTECNKCVSLKFNDLSEFRFGPPDENQWNLVHTQ